MNADFQIRWLAVAAAAFLLALSASAAAPVCVWTGNAGDFKWSSEGNWTNAQGVAVTPADGDKLVLPALTAPLLVTNDLEDIRLAGISLTGQKPVTIAGKRYVLLGNYGTGSSASWPGKSSDCAFYSPYNSVVSNLTEISLVGNSTLFASNGVYKAKIAASDDVTELRLESYGSWLYGCVTEFYGEIEATNAVLNVRSGGTHYYYGRVRVKKIYDDRVSGQEPVNNSWYMHCSAVGNEWESCVVGRWIILYADVAGAWPTNMTMRFYYHPTAGWDNESEKYMFTGNQTIDRIDQPVPPIKDGRWYNRNIIKAWYGYDLTLRGTASAVCYARCDGQFDLIWDPVGDYSQEFRDYIHPVSGTITVKGGTLVSGGTNVFENVTSIDVKAGAALDIASTNKLFAAFPSVTALTLGADARLYLTNGCVNGFSASPALTLSSSARVVVGEKATVPTFKTVTVDGVTLPRGTYAGSTDVPNAFVVPWLSGGGTLVVSGADGNYWKSATDGYWDDADNWTKGVPTDGQTVYVAAAGGDYTVRVTNGVSQTFDVKAFAGEGHRVRLAVESGVTNAATKTFRMMDGGFLDITNGGAYVVSGKAAVIVEAGGELRVSGGLFSLTNGALYNLSVAGTSAKTATVSMTSGKINIETVQYSSDGKADTFKVRAFGLLDVSGGTFELASRTWSEIPPLLTPMTDGLIRFSNDSHLIVRTPTYVENGKTNSFNGRNVFGAGETIFRDSSRFTYAGTDRQALGVTPTGLDETAVLTIADQARLDRSEVGIFYVGSHNAAYPGRRSILNVNSSAIQGAYKDGVLKDDSSYSQRWQLAHRALIGCDSGYGEVNVTSGLLALAGCYGANFGCARTASWSGGCTGVCHVSGGCLRIYGYRSSGWFDSTVPGGLTFGYGVKTSATAGRPYNGFMTVTGGVVTNRYGDTVLGAGRGYGEWRQSGGETQLRTTGVRVGVMGGEGLLVLSGGTFYNNGDTYVGGAGTNAFGEAGGVFVSKAGWNIHNHDAVGTLVVSGGTFKVNGTLYVGVDGDGTIEMAGSDGSLATATLVLSNTLLEAGTAYERQTHSTLRFVADANGRVAPITATSKVKVAAGASIDIDLTACPDSFRGRLQLLRGPLEGAFAADDIGIRASERLLQRAKVRQTANGVSLSVSDPIILIVR